MRYDELVDMPDAEECNERKKVFDRNDIVGVACWYPQMGGYMAKAVAFFNKLFKNENGCVDIVVWHDGDFPFTKGKSPRSLHHCSPDQFVEFGKFLKRRGDKTFREKFSLK